MNEQQKTEIEAAVFRRLRQHLIDNKDVQNIDLMILADFCRNCLSKWYRSAAEDQGIEMDYDAAREVVYGMPYSEWKDKHQPKATPEQMAYGNSLSLMSSSVTDFLRTGNAPQRRGNLANSRSPGAGSFPCKDGVMSLGVNEESHFANLARAMGRADWLTDPRYAERANRKAHSGELAAEIETELARKTAQDWEPILQNAGVPCARLRSLPEALASDQVRARGFVQTLPDGNQVPTLPFRLAGQDAYAPASGAPRHGADSDDIVSWLQTT